MKYLIAGAVALLMTTLLLSVSLVCHDRIFSKIVSQVQEAEREGAISNQTPEELQQNSLQGFGVELSESEMRTLGVASLVITTSLLWIPMLFLISFGIAAVIPSARSSPNEEGERG